MIHIDGSHGEGGGQILRTSLALSIATGTPFRLSRIRAGRARPGLMRQHLTCVQAAAAISGAEVTGASVGSQEITFAPGPVQAGRYHFSIGTAGGTSLVLQAVLPPLLSACGPSTITVEGGTHATAAPTFEFLDRALLPVLARARVSVQARLERHGFYPAGGGRVVVEVDPTREPEAIHIPRRGSRVSESITAVVSRLPGSIAVRESDVLCDRLAIPPTSVKLVQTRESPGPGNAMMVELEFEHITEVFSAIGAVDKPAERLARDLAEEVRHYIEGEQPVGPHLADQIMVPLAILAGGSYATGPLTEHSLTNMVTARLFGVEISHDAGTVSVRKLDR